MAISLRARNFGWLFAGLLGACSLGGPLRVDKKAKDYRTGHPGGGWLERRVDSSQEAADKIFESSRGNALLAIGSACGVYQTTTLEALARDLVGPLREAEILLQRTRPLDGREGLLTEARGRVDGVSVGMLAFVLRKNDCLFDFTLTAREPLRPEDRVAFENVLKGFRYE